MKNIIIVLAMLGGVMLFLQSCYYDNPPKPQPFECSDVSFSTHIVPILENQCATSNCHDGTSKPNLTTDVAFQNLNSQGYINTVTPEASLFYKTVIGLEIPMPPGAPISELNKELILCWISEGAENN